MPQNMIPASEVVEQFKSAGKGFDRIGLIPGSTYTDNSTVIVIPTRGMLHHRFVSSLQYLLSPMNQKCTKVMCAGDEVGHSYNRMISQILRDPELSTWKYIMTIEDDNLCPPDAHIRLLETIEWGKYDAVSGLYFTKGEVNMPMAYGDPEEFKRTGKIDFRPRDVRACLDAGRVMEVNGIAMGCALWRMELFKQTEAPWFVTVADVVEGKGAACFTQDLWACKRWKEMGKTFAVDCRVKVGHMDINTGETY